MRGLGVTEAPRTPHATGTAGTKGVDGSGGAHGRRHTTPEANNNQRYQPSYERDLRTAKTVNIHQMGIKVPSNLIHTTGKDLFDGVTPASGISN